MKLSAQVERSIRRDCMIAARDLLGDGYTTGYYSSAASDFAHIAEAYYLEGFEEGLKMAQRMAQDVAEKMGVWP